ncbi:CpaF family protein (plasmid) [Clostridium botulinum]|uniref:Type II secretion system protein E n=1 Tax=Clostridium botulinum (strain 657 / Type Ba4) TaxID=515621 RepID=A0A3F2ZQ38_CLOB6|nr:ATPase, T2SS/T4P/T4SS family [Clostridium botulinum]ACQ51132.1 type II secretion system protein E [Clostridium botulinum Ba4 str. 657]AXG90398.1 CpaF family protein [Clostridium botulinum]BDB03544.1 hypothetical protein CBOS2020_36180 [Clostridium botulinum]
MNYYKNKEEIDLTNFNFELLIQTIRPIMLRYSDLNGKDLKIQLRIVIKQHLLKSAYRSYAASNSTIDRITEEVYRKMYGLNVIDKYLALPDVTDVFMLGTKIMYIENGTRKLAPEKLTIDEVTVIYKKIASDAEISISTEEPSKDCELLDGSRVKLIIPPESIEPYIIIRKHNLASASLDELALMGLELPINTIKEPAIKKISKNKTENLIEIEQNQDIREYCKQAIIQRKNIVFVGPTGAGKTTFMNGLTHYIQKNHIVAVLEDTRELLLPLPYVYYLKTRNADGGKKPITYEDILNDCLRANPDRIMLTEIRIPESAYALIHVLNSGHAGSMTSIHAESALLALERLEMLIKEHKPMDDRTLRLLISKAVDIVIFLSLEEDDDGNKIGRMIKEIVEIHGINDDNSYKTKYVLKNYIEQ